MKTLIMKFGGAAVSSLQQFNHIADLIISRKSVYSQLVVVVSAMGKMTDELIQLAKEIHPSPPQREYDMLVSVGERISMALLAMSLCAKNQEAISFTGSQSGIMTCSNHSDARIINVRPQRIQTSLNQNKIVIVAGFQGVSIDKEITTLGRGGSDTSAVALGIALGAEKVEYFKNVPGIFKEYPVLDSNIQPCNYLTYAQALEIAKKGAKVLHARAIELAAKNRLPLQVRSFMSSYQDNEGTIIGSIDPDRKNVQIYEEI